MLTCPSCSRTCSDDSRFCPWCAARLDATSAETRVLVAAAPASRSHLSSSSGVDEGRFLPGTVLAGRYRIAGLLGRGGMGEVYRATDLTLGQAVALKFLPDTLARDERAQARFYNEVRMARQVTHPNVCRVYDIGQVDGLNYISMEYVDGEDLASLLRRIGRLPADKAVEIGRKLCAGLAAAHEKGVLHRDLKPANVMIDGRGQVIIMDFGLAGLSEQLQHADVRSGTPAYMSPEQLAGTEVTAKSDIYALGLLLYELFTGKRAFEAASLMELMQMQERGAPASLTTLVKELDPAVERVILRCLQHEPRQRPTSALAVAAGLPGGDMLAAALAAGETPSPDLVAAAGETEGLRPVLALAWLAAALVLIVAAGILGARLSIASKVPLDVPPEALARDARTLLKSFGYTAKPGDSVWSLDYDYQYLDYLKDHIAAAAARWANPAAGFPPVVVFWYRESPYELLAARSFNVMTSYNDPPHELSGMIRLRTDPEGKLQALEAIPPQVEPPLPPEKPAPAFDWSLLFRAAGLEPARFQPAAPQWTPLANWDARAAWTAGDLRVEAAAWRGKPIFFRIIGPWTSPERMQATNTGDQNPLPILVIIYGSLVAACFIAWRHVRSHKSDEHGAARLAILLFVSMFAAGLFEARHTASANELGLFWRSFSSAGLNAGVVWVFYLALEPWVRRRWPQTLISWSRYSTKGIRDPLVGRDLLYGAGLGSLWALLSLVQFRLHGAASEPVMPWLATLLGARWGIAALLRAVSNSLILALLFFFVLFIVRVVVRHQWIAAAIFIAILTLFFTVGTHYPAIDWPTNAVFAAFYAFVLLRFGLLALILANAVQQFLVTIPRTLDFSTWHATAGVAPLVLVALIAVYGFRISLAGKPLLKEDFF